MERSQSIFILIVVSGLCLFCWNGKSSSATDSPGVAPAAIVIAAIDKLQTASDTHFVAIDLAYVQTGAVNESKPGEPSLRQPGGVEPSPFILWRNDVTSQSGVWIMTLDPHTGAQRGNRLNVNFPNSWRPVDVLWTDHFASSPNVESGRVRSLSFVTIGSKHSP